MTSRIVDIVGRERIADSVDVASRVAPPEEWLGLGATLSRYASVTGRPWPPTRDGRCAEAMSRAGPTHVIVVFRTQCPRAVRAEAAVVARYRRMDWPRWRPAQDSVVADVIGGARRSSTGTGSGR